MSWQSWQDLPCGKGTMGNARMVQRVSQCAKVDFCGRMEVCGEVNENCAVNAAVSSFSSAILHVPMCTLSPSLMTSREPGCSFSLYQMRYPKRTAGAWHPHTLFPVSLSESEERFIFFFPPKVHSLLHSKGAL